MDELLWCCIASSGGRYRRCYTITTNSQNTHHVPAHVDARGALELGLLRTGRIDHLHEDEDHYEGSTGWAAFGRNLQDESKNSAQLDSSVDDSIA